MFHLPENFKSITLESIQQLVDDEVIEDKYLEYKRQLPGGSDKDKHEFLADVSAFANTFGGDIIFGIEEDDRHAPSKIVGIAEADHDEVNQRLENMLRSGLEPCLPDIQFRWVPDEEKNVLVIRIGRSWISPHRVTLKNASRFFLRTNAGKAQMDYQELKASFIASDTFGERAKQFQRERLLKLGRNENPAPIQGAAKFVLHLVPSDAFIGKNDVPARILAKKNADPLGTHSARILFNSHGVCGYETVGMGFCSTYTQYFRNLVIEAVETKSFLQENKYIDVDNIEKLLRERLPEYLASLKDLGANSPILVMMSLVSIRGYKYHRTRYSEMSDVPGIEIVDDVVAMPEVLIEDFDGDFSLALKPALDVLWNTVGMECSPE
jgi:hypothetical protein